MDKYSKIFYWSDDDNRFIVNVSTVIAEWIETTGILGREIPEPMGRRVSA